MVGTSHANIFSSSQICLFRFNIESKLRHKIHFLTFLGHSILIFVSFLLDEIFKSQCISHVHWPHNSHTFLEAHASLQPSPFRQLKLRKKFFALSKRI